MSIKQASLLTDGTEAGARLSDGGRYRWSLWRHWDRDRMPLGFIMLNPSTADAETDDPTIRRCIGFARSNGYGGIRVANLYGLRATDPAELLADNDPVGIVDPAYPRTRYSPWGHLIFSCRDIVLAWGAVGPAHADRVAEVLDDCDWPHVLSLGTTKDGSPRHPLYVRADQPLEPWPPDA